MSRVPRRELVFEGSTNHATWQAHNLEYVLDVDGAREKLLALFVKYKVQHGMKIRSYALMGTHPHVLCRSDRGQVHFSKFWQKVNQAFAKWYNKKQGRRGQVIMERLTSPIVQEETALLRVMRYIDLNPVKAGLVARPKDWAFSSHAHYAFGRPDPLVDDAPEYLALSIDPAKRRRAYLHMFATPLEEQADPEAIFDRAAFIGEAEWVGRMKRSLREKARDGPT